MSHTTFTLVTYALATQPDQVLKRLAAESSRCRRCRRGCSFVLYLSFINSRVIITIDTIDDRYPNLDTRNCLSIFPHAAVHRFRSTGGRLSHHRVSYCFTSYGSGGDRLEIWLTLSSNSIVAVHGLGGDAVNTWTHPKSKAFWLKDFLPQQMPDARKVVLIFSRYN